MTPKEKKEIKEEPLSDIIDAETLKGSWGDGTAELLEKYAPYLL